MISRLSNKSIFFCLNCRLLCIIEVLTNPNKQCAILVLYRKYFLTHVPNQNLGVFSDIYEPYQ